MVYKWSGYNYSADASEVGAEIEEIERKNGTVTTSAVVDAARNEKSVMHNLFEWNDTVAGEKYREHQARQILHALVVIPETNNQTRAFVNVVYGSQPGQTGKYVNLNTATHDPEMMVIILSNAIRELEAIQQKYSTLKELAGVFAEINKLLEKKGDAA